MSTITIHLSETSLTQLREQAQAIGISPEELARIGLEELLAQSPTRFIETMQYVLKKNEALYHRLA
ncbi:MAG: DNA-binding protein [Pseudomonadota bacterium]|nr:DNA-binding protein [Pseudomonadota bacterium]